MSHPEAATHTGDMIPPSDGNQVEKENAHTTPLAEPVVESQRENLIYTEDLDFLPVGKDPRYCFYRHLANKTFDIKNEDVVQAIENVQLLDQLELLQISRLNKSIEVKFESEREQRNILLTARLL